MRRVSALSAVLLTGCLAGPKGELWLFQIGTLIPECERVVEENFVDAKQPEEAAPDEDWTYTDDFVLSDRLVLATILKGKGGARTLILDGVVYPGVVEGGTYTFTWDGSTDAQTSQVHDAGYSFTNTVVSSTAASLTLEKDSEIKGRSGPFSIVTKTENAWSENDEWAFEEVGLPGGQIPAFVYLEGPGVANDPTQEDCTGPTCELSVADECTSEARVQATYMGRAGDQGFGDLQDAEMPYGEGGGAGSPPTTFPSGGG